jgi:hypothetical protein
MGVEKFSYSIPRGRPMSATDIQEGLNVPPASTRLHGLPGCVTSSTTCAVNGMIIGQPDEAYSILWCHTVVCRHTGDQPLNRSYSQLIYMYMYIGACHRLHLSSSNSNPYPISLVDKNIIGNYKLVTIVWK